MCLVEDVGPLTVGHFQYKQTASVQVVKISPRRVDCNILCVGGTPLTDSYKGALR